jgi:hypothetical protein
MEVGRPAHAGKSTKAAHTLHSRTKLAPAANTPAERSNRFSAAIIEEGNGWQAFSASFSYLR